MRALRVVAVAVFVSAGIVMPGLQGQAWARKMALPPRFPFTIDPKASVDELMPTPPVLAEAPLPWLVDDLALVPQVMFQKPHEVKKTDKDGNELQGFQFLRESMKQTAHGIAKINHVNKDGKDQFMKVLIKKRPDLQGLPFVMGDACRLPKDVSKQLGVEVAMVREGFAMEEQMKARTGQDENKSFWKRYGSSTRAKHRELNGEDPPKVYEKAQIAALMQMLMPESAEVRLGLVKHLVTFKDRPEAKRALVQMAVFSFEKEVREAALAAVVKMPKTEGNDVLLAALRYPWPAVAANAGEAIAKLNRKDLIPQLVNILDEPDARAPVEKPVNGRKAKVVREVVRINHHHNCLLCHSPGNGHDAKLDELGESSDFLTGAVPSPGQELPSPSQGYLRSSPDILVRVDVTYLRQDFSLRQKVEKAAPWPEMQRFDFLVREREVTAKDVEAYQTWLQKQGAEYVSPNQQAAMAALRGLTGCDAGPTAAAWRKVLAQR